MDLRGQWPLSTREDLACLCVSVPIQQGWGGRMPWGDGGSFASFHSTSLSLEQYPALR